MTLDELEAAARAALNGDYWELRVEDVLDLIDRLRAAEVRVAELEIAGWG